MIRLGIFLQSLPVVLLRPPDLAEFNRQWYEQVSSSYGSLNDPLVGLSTEEQHCREQLPEHGRTLLVLGAGGGREVIAFARQGYQVTGVDFSEGMLALAERAATEQGLSFQALTGEISQLSLPAQSFDIVWISRNMYSAVFTRQRRVAMLSTIHRILRKNGILVNSFLVGSTRESLKSYRLKKVIAWLTLGNRGYETGDRIVANREAIHAFSSSEALRSECTEGGFALLELPFFEEGKPGYAILEKI